MIAFVIVYWPDYNIELAIALEGMSRHPCWLQDVVEDDGAADTGGDVEGDPLAFEPNIPVLDLALVPRPLPVTGALDYCGTNIN